jgi:hypothetical protein
VDLLRGLVIAFMLLDHTRDFVHSAAMTFQPADLARTNVPLFPTRWITHFCAPVFVFLAGTGAYLQLMHGRPMGELRRSRDDRPFAARLATPRAHRPDRAAGDRAGNVENLLRGCALTGFPRPFAASQQVFYIQSVHRCVAIANAESTRLVTACTRIRSPRERVRHIHQL